MCTKINPSLFSKATTIEHIHKNPQNPQKSHLNHSSTRAQNPVAELTSQYSNAQEGRDLLVHRRRIVIEGILILLNLPILRIFEQAQIQQSLMS